ncbi:MAG: 50S ribosomal protein L25 [Candidatus Magasanikbacteria bacterium GW2011_GWA2_40_10]|uniref:Large ribosomal subunit protein bL25 n=1 Tax=Candidatus Magasanikbacteria bacterium GW2011_GWA2_40_10 TaxID=1619037 RepID=A0A0G0TAV2_9BACT|nr:MAG: 50S ribosomal protein L25 [Candidatus Magasanikbacteria bacterium GW2011_GWA2_40_10]
MSFKLSASARTEKGEKVRTKSVLPAVVYGMGGPATSVTLNYEEFVKLFAEAGEASLIDLLLGDKADGKVLVQDISYDPVSDRVIHVDLRRIDMNKELTATVELRFVGESPVIKAQGGTVMRSVENVEVKCLPKDLVSHIDVDLSVLKTFDDVVKVKDLIVPAGITITNPNAEDLVVKVTEALTEDEIKAMETAAAPVDLSKIETAGKKKEEGEEGAEGAAKPEAGEKKEEKKEEKK